MYTPPNIISRPLFTEILDRCRYDIPQFSRDFLDIEPHPRQIVWFDTEVWSTERAFVGGNRSGKDQPNTEPILTPTGWKPMGEIKVGDTVFSQDGKPTQVTGVFPQGLRHAYRFVFDDGSSTLSGDEHLWTVRTARERFRKNYNKKPGYGVKKLKVPNTQYRQWTTRTTKQILDQWGAEPRAKNRCTIPVVKPVEFQHQDVPLDPYALGLLIGDGSMGYSAVGFTTADIELLPSLTLETVRRAYGGQYDYGVIGAQKYLRPLGLMGCRSWEKFIPKLYLWNDTPTRIAILQGLMDTDGSADGKKHTLEYCTTSKQLADDFLFLVQSLGGKGKIATKRPFCNYKGKRVEGKLAYRVSFHIPNVCPFRLERKKKLWSEKATTQERILMRIEDAGWHESTCIEVANPSALYVTRDFIVTHNTVSSAIKHLHGLLFQPRLPQYAKMTHRYVRVQLSLTLDMALIGYTWAINRALDSPLYRRFIREDEMKAHPFPVFVVGDGKKGRGGFRSELWARSATHGAKYLLGKDIDFVNFDEAAFQPDGEEILNSVILMRLADRSGQIDFTSSPNGKNWFYEFYQKTQKAPEQQHPPHYYFGMSVTSYDNPHVDHERLAINEERLSPEARLQNIMGVFADVNGIFSSAAIERCYKDVDYSLPVPPVERATYIKAADFARKIDQTVIFVARTDVSPAELVFVQKLGGEREAPIGWTGEGGIYEAIAKVHHRYPGNFYGDSTGPGGDVIFDSLRNVYDIPMIESNVAGSRGKAKENLVLSGKHVLDDRRIIFPYQRDLVDELHYYVLPDENIKTDLVMAFCILGEGIRKESYAEDTPEEAGAVWASANIDTREGCTCRLTRDLSWCLVHHMPIRDKACCEAEFVAIPTPQETGFLSDRMEAEAFLSNW